MQSAHVETILPVRQPQLYIDKPFLPSNHEDAPILLLLIH